MSPLLTSSKIQPRHLDLEALIYVRQSCAMQVRDHTGSTARQYDLERRARDLGWEKTVRMKLLGQRPRYQEGPPRGPDA
jgi:hypothetical protein